MHSQFLFALPVDRAVRGGSLPEGGKRPIGLVSRVANLPKIHPWISAVT